jgi:tRNA-splicing endonuclease subunit Sen34
MGNTIIYTQVSTQHPFQVSANIVTDVLVSNDIKYKIFRDLWLKSFFITGGDSFGCDFLTYPGDPMCYHASQIVHVIDRSKMFDVKFLISCARLSVSVNKKCVFAYVNDDETVTYQTLHWDNPKLRQIYTQQKPSQTS